MASQGGLFRFCRWVLRIYYRRYTCKNVPEMQKPVVYICRHRRAIGPVASLCALPTGIRPWILAVFTNKQDCLDQCKNYTFPVAWRVKKPFVAPLAAVLCPLFTALVNSTDPVPVYRNSLKVRETFNKSIEALENGDSLLIFPDVNYDEKEGKTGQIYEGFLLLEQLWFRKKKEHIRFVPINISTENETMTIGEVISFSGEQPYNVEKDVIAQKIENVFDEMAEKYGI